MTDEQNSVFRNKFRRVIVTGSYLIGVFSPIKVAYDYIAKGNLAPISINTNLTLPQLLISLFHLAGATVIGWLFAVLGFGLIFYLPLLFLCSTFITSKESKERVKRALLVALLVGCVIFTIYAAFSSGIKPLELAGFQVGQSDWIITLIGAVALLFAYVVIWTQIRSILDENAARNQGAKAS